MFCFTLACSNCNSAKMKAQAWSTRKFRIFAKLVALCACGHLKLCEEE